MTEATLEATQTKSGQISDTYTSVVMIRFPGLDEIAAKFLLGRIVGAKLGIHAFAESLNMTDDEINDLDSSGIFVIDLGSKQYKNQSCRSATEAVAKEFDIQLTEAETRLVEIINQDNETGVLNKYVDSMSIPWTLRKLFGIAAYAANPEDVVSRVSHVIDIWLKYMNNERDPARIVKEMPAEFPDLIEKFRLEKLRLSRPKSDLQYNHFTALRYLRDMWYIGVPAEEIRERVKYWVNAYRQVQTAIAEGEKQFASLSVKPFLVGRLTGVALESGDIFLNRAALCKHDILVAKDPTTGHALIATHGLDIERLVVMLNRRDPGNWFEVRGWAVNGGLRNRGTKSTGATVDELQEMVQKYPPMTKETGETLPYQRYR